MRMPRGLVSLILWDPKMEDQSKCDEPGHRQALQLSATSLPKIPIGIRMQKSADVELEKMRME